MSFWKKAKQTAIVGRLIEEQLYAQVFQEIESGVRRDGLWAKALEKSRGNEPEAKSLYIQYRVQSIRDELELSAPLYQQSTSESVQPDVERNDAYDDEAREQAAHAKELEQLDRESRGLADRELASAVWEGNWSVANRLLREGVRPTGADENGNSLLGLARKRSDLQMIRLLESYGAK